MKIIHDKCVAIHEKINIAVISCACQETEEAEPSWRKFAPHAFGLLILLFGISASSLASEDPAQPEPIYRLRLYQTHTNERIDVVYRIGDVYIPSAIDRLDRFLRDHRTGDVIQLDRRVFDLLHDLTAAVGRPESEIDIICGYRTPWSNEFSAAPHRVSLLIVCICWERLSISAYRASRLHICGTLLSPFTVEESDITRSRGSFTWMWAGFVAGKFLLLLRKLCARGVGNACAKARSRAASRP